MTIYTNERRLIRKILGRNNQEEEMVDDMDKKLDTGLEERVEIPRLTGWKKLEMPEGAAVNDICVFKNRMFLATDKGIFEVIPAKKWWQF